MNMPTDRDTIDALWAEGYRPFEIYTCNEVEVEYFGEVMAPGDVLGWNIKHVFAKRESLKNYPFFDAIICGSCVAVCEEMF